MKKSDLIQVSKNIKLIVAKKSALRFSWNPVWLGLFSTKLKIFICKEIFSNFKAIHKHGLFHNTPEKKRRGRFQVIPLPTWKPYTKNYKSENKDLPFLLWSSSIPDLPYKEREYKQLRYIYIKHAPQTHNQLWMPLPEFFKQHYTKVKVLPFISKVSPGFCPRSVMYMHHMCNIWQCSEQLLN